MSTEIKTNWPWIVRFFKKSLSSHHFYTFAMVDPDGRPHIAPLCLAVLQ